MAVTSGITAERVERARQAMVEEDVDLLLVSPGSDLRYLMGYGGHASERPTLLAVHASREPLILVPQLEAPRLGTSLDLEVVAYDETDDPYAVLAGALADAGSMARIALSDQAWAVVLMRLQERFDASRFQPAGRVLRRLRMVKSDEELISLARAGSMADEAFAQIASRSFLGRTEREVATELRSLLAEQGLTLGEWGPIVAGGPNSASPHHLTGDRIIAEGDAVVLDFGGSVNGYQADITRTVHVGSPSSEFSHVYDIVRQAQQAGFSAVGPGVTAESVDTAARGVIDAAGYGDFFIHRTGHGIGLDGHEEPYIVAGNRLALEPGMTFSIEPGVYLPGRFGVRIEDIVAVTEDGARSFNHATHDAVAVR